MSKTNADRIREMSIKELAEFLHNTFLCTQWKFCFEPMPWR
jgi:hypothetical protein